MNFICFSEARIRLGPANENDKQLKWFSDACKGIPQVGHILCVLIVYALKARVVTLMILFMESSGKICTNINTFLSRAKIIHP